MVGATLQCSIAAVNVFKSADGDPDASTAADRGIVAQSAAVRVRIYFGCAITEHVHSLPRT
jgi:hypothetical protein